MSNDGLISIIMPAYNSENTIDEAITSVINQSYLNWELIVINDCSKDGTEKKINNYISEYSEKKIIYIKNEINLGVSESRNLAIQSSKGEWIAFLDSDDKWETTKLKKQIDLSKSKKADFIFTGSKYINGEGKKFNGRLEVPIYVDYKALKKHNIISCSSVLIKREIIINNKMKYDYLHEDYLVWLKILKSGVVAFGVNEPLLIYRIDQNSKSGNKLKSIKMTFNVFRKLDYNTLFSTFYTISHLYRSIIKYKKIFSRKKRLVI